MLYVAETLATMKNTRKVIVYLEATWCSSRTSMTAASGHCGSRCYRSPPKTTSACIPWTPMGLRPQPRLILNPYLSLARETGGHAVLFSNSFDEGLKRIFAENSSYYLLAYQPVTLKPTRSGR